VVRERAAPFATTRRWLRGRLLDRLRDADDGDWISFDGPVGVHDRTAVSEALRGLARDGLVDLAPGIEPLRARLPTA
jgi:hypothetical protein